MPLLTVTKNTFFKKINAQSTNPPPQKIFNVDAGQSFDVKYAFQVGDHYFIKLHQPLDPVGKIGYFFKDHVKVQAEELRGVWLTSIDSNILSSSDTIKTSLEKLKKLGFNTIYPVVWQRGFTLYPSDIAKNFIGSSVMPNSAFENRDMLAEVITEAKKHDFRVIPWFEYGLMTLPDSQLEQRHPELLTLDSREEKIRLKSHDGNKPDEHVWLNPCHLEVQKFMVDLITDVAARYDIDGIQLDDHFSFPVELGYDEITQKLFKDENGGKDAPDDHKDEAWVEWASGKVTNLLTQVFHAVKDKRPDCIISISPNPQDFSKKYYLADWKAWEQKGLAEELVLQVYRNNVSEFDSELDKQEVIEARKHIPFGVGILTGLKGKPVDSNLINKQVKNTRAKNFAGVSFFFYETVFNEMPVDDKGNLQIIARTNPQVILA